MWYMNSRGVALDLKRVVSFARMALHGSDDETAYAVLANCGDEGMFLIVVCTNEDEADGMVVDLTKHADENGLMGENGYRDMEPRDFTMGMKSRLMTAAEFLAEYTPKGLHIDLDIRGRVTTIWTDGTRVYNAAEDR